MQIVDVAVEEIMVCASCKIHENGNGFSFETKDVTGYATDEDVDAASYRTTLWD